MAETLLRERMWVDPCDYKAFHTCVSNDAVEIAKLLLDGGVDFEGYQQWAQARCYAGHEETLQALSEHWPEPTATMEGEKGAPIEAQRSGFDGERSPSEMSDLSPQAEGSDMELGATTGGMTFG